MENPFQIVHETNEILVVNKPAGLVCHPTKTDYTSSLIGRVRHYLGEAVPAHLVNRLDRETSGLVLIAKSSSMAGELGKIWERREVQKRYQAIVHGKMEGDGVIDAPLGKDESSEVAIRDCVRVDGSPAQTEYAVAKNFEKGGEIFSLVNLRPRSGRKHQIRIHLEHMGHPIVGDKLYGVDRDFYLRFVRSQLSEEDRARLILPWQALHAHSLEFTLREIQHHYTTPPEPWFSEFAGTP